MKCKHCHKQTTYRCSCCKVVCYCNKQCQIQDWTKHKYECKQFKKYILDWLEGLTPEERKTKVCVFALKDADARKNLHQCIERATNTFSRSLKCSNIPAALRHRCYKNCPECGQKNIDFSAKNYHYGEMENNKDEYYSIQCPKCNYSWIWECNYDGYDCINLHYGNNCVVVGDAMKHFTHNKCAQTSKLKESDCPMLPNLFSYNSINYYDLPLDLRGVKNLVHALSDK